jgi:hypothetical protein
MANTIRIKRRATGSAGAPSSLANAEVAFNEVDNTLYYGKGGTSTTADTIIPIAGPGAFVDLTSNQTVDGDKSFVATVNINSLQLNGAQVTANAAELNQLDDVTPGTASASKALVVDANKDLDLAGGDLTVQDLVVNGDLTVNGTETILNTQTLEVEDKNIEMGVVATPSDASADGGGIILKGTTDKSLLWYDASDAWESSEHISLAAGKKFQIDGDDVLTATALGSGVVSSSLTSVGVIGTGTWEGDAVDIAYGGTGETTAQAAIDALTQSSGASNGQVLTRNSSGHAVWETPADSGITSLNGLTVDTQTFAIGTDATQEVPYWSSAAGVHTLNIPYATNAVRGLVSNQNQLFGGRKAFLDGATVGEGSGIGGTFDVYNTGSAPAVLIKKANGATGEAIKFIDHTSASVFVVNASGAVTTGSWSGTAIAVANGGTGATDAATARENLGVEIGVDVQEYSDKLQSIVDLSGTFSAGIVQVVGYSDANTAEFVETTAFGRSLIGDASASDARSTLGLVIGTDVQAFNSNLSAISGLTSATDKVPYFTGSGTAAVADFSSFGRSLVDDADASAARTTLGLGTIATQAANNVSITGGSIDNVVFDGGSF